MQMASVITRKRGFLRRCAPQDDKRESAPRNDCLFVILSGTTWSEESRACAFARQGDYTRMARRVVAQASFSWTFGPIHLLAPYGVVSHPKGGQLT